MTWDLPECRCGLRALQGISAKGIMFFNRLQDLPGTGEARRKGDQVAAIELLGFTVVRGQDELAAKYVAGLLPIVFPGELGNLFFPDGPVVYAEDFQFGR